MTDVLRQRLLDALNRTLSPEAEDAGDSGELEAATPAYLELALTTDDLPADPKDERARVAAGVAGALLANGLLAQADAPDEPAA